MTEEDNLQNLDNQERMPLHRREWGWLEENMHIESVREEMERRVTRERGYGSDDPLYA